MMTRGFRWLGAFTLTELLTTLAVLAIVLSVGLPGVREFISDNRRAAETNYLLSALERARAEARRTHRTVTVCPSRDAATCAPGAGGWQVGFIVFSESDRGRLGVRDPEDQLLETYSTVRGEARLLASSALTDFVAFRADGTPFASGEFAWCDARGPRFGRSVIVPSSGEAAVSETSAAGKPLTCRP